MSKGKAAALAPDEQMNRLYAASTLLREGRGPEAIAALRVLSVMAPSNGEAKRLLGVALNEQGDCAGAEVAFRAALALKPDEASVAVGLAEALIAQKKGDQAVEALRPFVNEQTTNFSLLTWAGLALQSAGRFRDAVAMFRRALWVEPDSGLAHHNLAGALVDDRDYAAAQAEEARARALGLDGSGNAGGGGTRRSRTEPVRGRDRDCSPKPCANGRPTRSPRWNSPRRCGSPPETPNRPSASTTKRPRCRSPRATSRGTRRSCRRRSATIKAPTPP